MKTYRYYFDVTADQASVEATSEEEAMVKIRELIDKLGVGFEIYDTEPVEPEPKVVKVKTTDFVRSMGIEVVES